MQTRPFILMVAIFILPFVIPIGARENSTMLYKKGVSLVLKKQLKDAEKVFKRVIKINPYYSLGHYGLGRVYLMKRGYLKEAVRHLKKSVSLDRRLAKGYFYLGMAHMLSKQYMRAIGAFKNSYKYDNKSKYRL